MWANLNQKNLYGLVLLLAAALIVIALGGGLFNQSGLWFDHWQHKAFRGLCHQDPERSFWLNGTPMAVCSRCFGIYAGFFASWMLFPMASRGLQRINGYKRWLLVGIVLLNLIDIIGNFVGLWQNTLASRFLMGALIGVTVVLILGYEFIGTKQLNIKGIHYGTDRTV